ncbi:MAG: class I SAM-dependent methyltransferase [Oscillatoriales cyanobacterium RM2_1_1]|nr:class I SAM-dependent methyltransferase [Oscillatoriales cyanobacterium SM2_3_0]NJO46150.1 class I SAM-dependent methyltransferase [Oscillatoriales cyanobacterium RM2_1_1]
MSTNFLDFSPRLKNIIETGKSIDENRNTIDVAGTSTINNLKVIRGLILDHSPRKTLEIGLAYGASALAILASLREVHPDNNYLHTAIDPFQKTAWKNSALVAIEEENLQENFRFLSDFSCFALPSLYKSEEKFDLVYIDGSHLFEDVLVDFYFVSRLLTLGGVILFDDCSDNHINKVIQFIKSNYRDFLVNFSTEKFTNKSFPKRLANQLGYRQIEAFRLIAYPPRKWNAQFYKF